MSRGVRIALTVSSAIVAGALSPGAQAQAPMALPGGSRPAGPSGPSRPHTHPPAPLAGETIVVDPGHQLGNSRFPARMNRSVDAHGLWKACNTTGTASDSGYPEATFTFRVAERVRDRLRQLGATVVMTRATNGPKHFGPCVDVRGKIGDKGFRGRTHDADLKLSIHGDGSAAGNHGFHVIVATKKPRRAASTAYAKDVRGALQKAGFQRSSYIGGGTALSFRGDLGTLNWSRMPAVMVELGNMRNPGDARRMTSPAGQQRYATALVRGIRAYLSH